MAAPSNVKVIIKTVDDAIKLLKDPRANEMRLMVLVPNVKDAVKVAKAFPTEIELMNVGNAGKMTPPSEDKKTLSKEVMLTDSEIQDLKELVELYPDTVFQPTPAMEKRSAKSILSDF